MNETEAADVVAILRASTDLGDANRELRRQFPQWGLAQRLAALRQAQNLIAAAWQKSPGRKRRESLARSHAGEAHKAEEDQP